MRAGTWILITLLAVSICSATGQQNQSDADDNTAAVNGALVELRAGLFTGFTQKRLTQLGDEAANTTIRDHTLEEMRAEPMAIAIARLIAISFNSPTRINKEGDKTPKMSALLLAYLRSSVKTPEGIKAVDLATQTVDRQLEAQGRSK
jgi:hypothetical protein